MVDQRYGYPRSAARRDETICGAATALLGVYRMLRSVHDSVAHRTRIRPRSIGSRDGGRIRFCDGGPAPSRFDYRPHTRAGTNGRDGSVRRVRGHYDDPAGRRSVPAALGPIVRILPQYHFAPGGARCVDYGPSREQRRGTLRRGQGVRILWVCGGEGF